MRDDQCHKFITRRSRLPLHRPGIEGLDCRVYYILWPAIIRSFGCGLAIKSGLDNLQVLNPVDCACDISNEFPAKTLYFVHYSWLTDERGV